MCWGQRTDVNEAWLLLLPWASRFFPEDPDLSHLIQRAQHYYTAYPYPVSVHLLSTWESLHELAQMFLSGLSVPVHTPPRTEGKLSHLEMKRMSPETKAWWEREVGCIGWGKGPDCAGLLKSVKMDLFYTTLNALGRQALVGSTYFRIY